MRRMQKSAILCCTADKMCGIALTALKAAPGAHPISSFSLIIRSYITKNLGNLVGTVGVL